MSVSAPDPNLLQQIKRSQDLSSVIEQWIGKVTLDGLIFIEEAFKLFSSISSKRETMIVDFQTIRKDNNNLSLVSKEIQEMAVMDVNILLAEEVLNYPKEMNSVAWADIIEWKLSIVGALEQEMRSSLALYYS